jgi:hypothetical protein
VTYRLVVGSAVGARAPVTLCWTIAPSARSSCTRRTTDGRGLVTLAIVTRGHLTIWARYDGAARVARADARPVMVSALPRATIRGGYRSIRLFLAPVARNQKVTIMRYTGSSWVRVGTRTVPVSGRLTVTGLARGKLYRVSVPATDRTLAATTSAVRVR